MNDFHIGLTLFISKINILVNSHHSFRPRPPFARSTVMVKSSIYSAWSLNIPKKTVFIFVNFPVFYCIKKEKLLNHAVILTFVHHAQRQIHLRYLHKRLLFGFFAGLMH